jgi:hypothetical protein
MFASQTTQMRRAAIDGRTALLARASELRNYREHTSCQLRALILFLLLFLNPFPFLTLLTLTLKKKAVGKDLRPTIPLANGDAANGLRRLKAELEPAHSLDTEKCFLNLFFNSKQCICCKDSIRLSIEDAALAPRGDHARCAIVRSLRVRVVHAGRLASNNQGPHR